MALSCLGDFQLAKLCAGLCYTRNEVVCDMDKVNVIFAKGAGFDIGLRASRMHCLTGAILACVNIRGKLERHLPSARAWHVCEREFKNLYKV